MKRNSKKQKGYSNDCLNTTKEEYTNNDDDNDYDSENDINDDVTDRNHKINNKNKEIVWPKPPTEMTVVKLSYINLS